MNTEQCSSKDDALANRHLWMGTCYDYEPGQGLDDFPKSQGHSYGMRRLVNLSKLFRFYSFTGGKW